MLKNSARKREVHLFGKVKLPLRDVASTYGAGSLLAHYPRNSLSVPRRWCESCLVENIATRILGGVKSGECVQEGTFRCF
jgi:hypothetical protein